MLSFMMSDNQRKLDHKHKKKKKVYIPNYKSINIYIYIYIQESQIKGVLRVKEIKVCLGFKDGEN